MTGRSQVVKGATAFRPAVERFLAWIMHPCRDTWDYEQPLQPSESLIDWTALTHMTRRITPPKLPQAEPDPGGAQRD
ncbi:hypothetical protein ACFY30_37380 [Streptomyces sp. NPDC000345]|uniref:hypothetical protein n=1 Tax=Streptomyces sp. NPDC000345 TaxID=3364537 RepID=UPI0036B1393D